MNQIELKDLVGLHKLDGVDFKKEKVKDWCGVYEDCSACYFRLDGVVYGAIADPNEGRRSAMGNLVIDDKKVVMENVFKPVDVFIRHKTKDGFNKTDILEMYEVKKAEIVLEIGTDGIGDIDSCFVAYFHPERV